MTTISMNEFGRDWNAVIVKVKQGETVVVTDDGKPAVRIEPVSVPATSPQEEEPRSYADLAKLWDASNPECCRSLTNEGIDRVLYGS